MTAAATTVASSGATPNLSTASPTARHTASPPLHTRDTLSAASLTSRVVLMSLAPRSGTNRVGTTALASDSAAASHTSLFSASVHLSSAASRQFEVFVSTSSASATSTISRLPSSSACTPPVPLELHASAAWDSASLTCSAAAVASARPSSIAAFLASFATPAGSNKPPTSLASSRYSESGRSGWPSFASDAPNPGWSVHFASEPSAFLAAPVATLSGVRAWQSRRVAAAAASSSKVNLHRSLATRKGPVLIACALSMSRASPSFATPSCECGGRACQSAGRRGRGGR